MKRKLWMPFAALILMVITMSSCYVGPGYYGRPHYHHHYHRGYYRY